MTTLHVSELMHQGVVGDLAGADRLMNEAVFIGTYPGLTEPMLDYMLDYIVETIRAIRCRNFLGASKQREDGSF
jgi:hypothetical protein